LSKTTSTGSSCGNWKVSIQWFFSVRFVNIFFESFLYFLLGIRAGFFSCSEINIEIFVYIYIYIYICHIWWLFYANSLLHYVPSTKQQNEKSTSFKDNEDNTYYIQGSINCKTVEVIYCILWTECEKSIYVGQTGDKFYQRMLLNFSKIRTQKGNRTRKWYYFLLCAKSVMPLNRFVLRHHEQQNTILQIPKTKTSKKHTHTRLTQE
jgi:hypothetical protein